MRRVRAPRPSGSERVPSTADEARARLESGNQAFVRSLPPSQPSHIDAQAPFAAVVACSDARAPVQTFLATSVNELFVVRVAGNVLGTECIGSIDFAVTRLPSVRLLAVIGHTSCGAVSTAADVFLAPETYLEVASNYALRTIIDSIMSSVRAGDEALQAVHGRHVATSQAYRDVLVDVATVAHAAVQATALAHTYRPRLGTGLAVTFAVLDLATSLVGVPAGEAGTGWEPGLRPPPADQREHAALLRTAASGPYVRHRL